jgi:phosphoglycolate phosphatase
LKNKIDLVVFDLDGVLIDSRRNMLFSWKKVKKNFCLRQDFSEYRKYIGLPFDVILKKIGIHYNNLLIKKSYFEYSNLNINKIKLFKDSKKFLNFLKKKNIKIAIFTSKDQTRSFRIIKNLSISYDYFLSSEQIKYPKPSGFGVKKICSYFKINNKNTLYIGDTYFDYLVAKSSHVNYAHVNWGFKKKIKKNVVSIKNFFQLRDSFNF